MDEHSQEARVAVIESRVADLSSSVERMHLKNNETHGRLGKLEGKNQAYEERFKSGEDNFKQLYNQLNILSAKLDRNTNKILMFGGGFAVVVFFLSFFKSHISTALGG